MGGLLAYIALHKPHWNNKYKNVQSMLGGILLLLGLIFISRDREFPGWWVLLPTMGAFLLISAGSNAVINNRVLSNKVFLWFGLISYPLYLWHWPLLSFTGMLYGLPVPQELRFGVILISIILAWLTYRFIEKPFRFGEHGKTKTIMLFSFMICIFIGGILSNHYIQPRHSNVSADLQRVISASSDWEYPHGLKKYGTNIKRPREYYIDSKNSDTTLLLGDSHVDQYSPRVVSVIKNNPLKTNSAILISEGYCPPIPDVFRDHTSCGDIVNRALDLIKRMKILK